MNIPVPHKCFDCRSVDRLIIRNPQQLFDRKCDQCSVDIRTTFSPNQKEEVYCEKCYLNLVK